MSQQFIGFVVARHNIYLNRAAGEPPPWTDDPILQTYRFCNVYRELDRVTIYIRKKYRDTGPRLHFDLTVARLVNNPDTLADLPVYSRKGKWDADEFVAALHARRDAGGRVFNPAYIVSTNGRAMDKAEYLAQHVLTPLWRAGPLVELSLQKTHERLTTFQGLGSFMAAQVVADLKNTAGHRLFEAPDWHTWAAPGPGSLRGLNRVIGRGGVTGWPSRVTSWLDTLLVLRAKLNGELPRKWRPLCAQDVQNCLCEYDKYERVRLGEGTPKQLFKPS